MQQEKEPTHPREVSTVCWEIPERCDLGGATLLWHN
jgi:hypothetical protein